MEPTAKHTQYMIGGVPVLFPCKPYPSQIAMMAKVTVYGNLLIVNVI